MGKTRSFQAQFADFVKTGETRRFRFESTMQIDIRMALWEINKKMTPTVTISRVGTSTPNKGQFTRLLEIINTVTDIPIIIENPSDDFIKSLLKRGFQHLSSDQPHMFLPMKQEFEHLFVRQIEPEGVSL